MVSVRDRGGSSAPVLSPRTYAVETIRGRAVLPLQPVKLRFARQGRNRSHSEGCRKLSARRISSKMAKTRENRLCLAGSFLLCSGRFPEDALRAPSTPLRSAQNDLYSLGASPASDEFPFKAVRYQCVGPIPIGIPHRQGPAALNRSTAVRTHCPAT